MNQKTAIKHVGLQYTDQKSAKIFFSDILGLNYIKSFSLSKDLTKSIFEISEEVKIDVYENDQSYFEIIISENISKHQYDHICIEIENKEELIQKCKKHGLKTILVDKGEKKLLFIKDFSGNLYEIKQRE